MLYGYGKYLGEILANRNLWNEVMEGAHAGPTLGVEISTARKGLRQTQKSLLASHPLLGDLLTVRQLNDIEHERFDVRLHIQHKDLLRELGRALGISVSRLTRLAGEYPRANATALAFNRQVALEFSISKANA